MNVFEDLRTSLPLDDPNRHTLDGAADAAFSRLIVKAPAAGWHSARVFSARLTALLAVIEREGGPWTPGRVLAAYACLGIRAPKRSVARHDLHALYLAGRLALHDQPGRRFYTSVGGER